MTVITPFLGTPQSTEELKASHPETDPDQTKTEKHPINTTRDNVRTKFLISISSPVSVSCHTESQNGRGWKGPLEIIYSNPPAKAGSPQQAAQDLVQAGLEYLQRRRIHKPPWAACSRAPSPSEGRSSSSCSDETSYASVCAHCPKPSSLSLSS